MHGVHAASVVTAFLSASAMFGAAAIYGARHQALARAVGGMLFMGLIGLLVAMRHQHVPASATWLSLDHLDHRRRDLHRADRVRRPAHPERRARRATGSIEKAAVIGALHLYLDFINLFLFLLRLFGGRN